MQTSIAFLCQIISNSYYCTYLENGLSEVQPAHAVTFSLLPLVTRGADVVSGATLWVLPAHREHLLVTLTNACEKGARVIVCEEQDKNILDTISTELRASIELVIVPNSGACII